MVGSASAQEVVHALSGTVTSINTQSGTLQISTNDGSEGTFHFAAQSAVPVNFDRNVREVATPVGSLTKSSDEVVVFYYGNNSVRNAVAVQDLGAGPFTTVEGTVTGFNKHAHQLTIKTSAGKTQAFQMDPKAVADTMDGAVPGERFSPSKGDNVRVIASGSGPQKKAVFVRD